MRSRSRYKMIRPMAFLVAFVLLLAPSVSGAQVKEQGNRVLLGGMTFGVSFKTGELKIGGFDDIETESGICSPAKNAGLLKNDIIKTVDGKAAESAVDVTAAVKGCNGKALTLQIKRGEELLDFCITPARSKETGDFRIGIWLEDSSAGLGTVTYIDEKTGAFGGLGHGIVKGETGKLCEFSKGIVCEVTVSGVTKGEKGTPGELKGDFESERIGIINKNTEKGVFGYFSSVSDELKEREIEICKSEDVKNAGVSIYSTVDGEGIKEYAAVITCIEDSGAENKNFLITITDTELIEKTGGIVRGMSGSPVVQDGKLIGAVTHVLVDDPTKGYGIFIENMMNAA